MFAVYALAIVGALFLLSVFATVVCVAALACKRLT
jgi:hypothetical protein